MVRPNPLSFAHGGPSWRRWVPAAVGVVTIASVAVIELGWMSGLIGDQLHTPAMLALVAAAGIAVVYANFSMMREMRRRSVSEDSRVEELSRDGTTGALLRRSFLDACTAAVADALARGPLAYFAIDMDYLKVLNDSLGHDVGDAALRRLVAAIVARGGPRSLVGRLGGDEFAFIAPCRNEEEALSIARRLLADIAKPRIVEGRELSLSATIGIVMLPGHTSNLSEAVRFSDLALYHGKKNGRRQATLFDREMLSEFRQQQQIERELRLGLDRHELRQLYLPVVDADRDIVLVRASVEWTSLSLGPVSSDTFLRIAETTNLIDRVGEWSLRRACLDAHRLPNPIAIAVPISAAQLKRDDVVDMVRRVLRETRIAGSRIIAHVERSSALFDNPDTKRRLNELRGFGVRICLGDLSAVVGDFGRMGEFPVDAVRLDAERIARIGENGAVNAVICAIAGVGKAMGLKVIADGIGTEEQFVLARTAGCDLFSGPLVSAAVPVDTVPLWPVAAAGRRQRRFADLEEA